MAGFAGCNPRFNWRELRSPDGFIVLLPGRAQTVKRDVKLQDATVQMSMTSTGIGATLFAVGVAQLPPMAAATPAGRQQLLAGFRDALVRNVSGTIVNTSMPPQILAPGLPSNSARTLHAAEAIEASGRDANGRAVRLAARFFIVDDRLFQVVALGEEGELPAEALDTFFTSFRLI